MTAWILEFVEGNQDVFLGFILGLSGTLTGWIGSLIVARIRKRFAPWAYDVYLYEQIRDGFPYYEISAKLGVMSAWRQSPSDADMAVKNLVISYPFLGLKFRDQALSNAKDKFDRELLSQLDFANEYLSLLNQAEKRGMLSSNYEWQIDDGVLAMSIGEKVDELSTHFTTLVNDAYLPLLAACVSKFDRKRLI